MSALCKLPFSDLDEVVKSLLIEYAKDDNTYFTEIDKFGDINTFWALMEKYYGYILEEKTIEHLSAFFLITALYYTLEDKIPAHWEKFISPKKADCFVFLSNFMNNAKAMDYFDMLSIKVEKQLNLRDYADKWHIDNYVVSDVFKIFDETIINKLIENLISDAGEFERYTDIILQRRTKHWYRKYENDYNCVYWALVMLDSWRKIKDDIKEDKPYDLFQKYAGQYYIIDMAYRKFIYFFDKLPNKEPFFELKEKIENTYVNGYLNQLSIKWSDSLETLEQNWKISPLELQQDFYINHVKPYEDKDERVFVIISDGLRYEAAKELEEDLNTERKGSTKITPMLGILPSY
ncbi:PglZ domain-containing protein, partial [Tepidanaerobacter sp. EBM-38]|uniref:PglZ domain-containing protein n=1 Tax=Tepidanaerobacter sp. EBM-38 TaxID=1918496 RepID=UPI0025F93AD4